MCRSLNLYGMISNFVRSPLLRVVCTLIKNPLGHFHYSTSFSKIEIILGTYSFKIEIPQFQIYFLFKNIRFYKNTLILKSGAWEVVKCRPRHGHLLNKQEQHYYRSLEHSTTYFYYLLIRYQHFLKNRNACPHIWWVH